ncbi:SDR family NAD(P)-dependent oxidoreductase [Streptomyces sp. NPDC005065]|uniref:SDR family NAD(P)-dependent oxidoreductase n=1 Tax=Streptomyces sp. NPDC005065 TaxID=3154461 RepID=UPI0033B153C5
MRAPSWTYGRCIRWLRSTKTTGATSGIGRAVANRLAADGMSVIVTGRNAQRGAQTVSRDERVRRGGGLSLKAGLPSAAQGGAQAQADSCETFEGGDLVAGFRSGRLAQVVAAGGLRSQERRSSS